MKKRLLILGATSETSKLVAAANEMEVETVVVDPYENAPAKKYATYSIEHDCYDVEGICKIAENYNIDGVLPGCADILVPVYDEVCRRLNKYCYVNKQLVNTFNNKKGLKDILVKHGLYVIKDYQYEEIVEGDFKSYPIFVKPVDNNSSKGMSIVHNLEEFEDAYNKALSFSKSKTVLIEDYKECDDFYIGYFAQNGNIGVTFTGDRFTIKQENVGSITSGIIYPSKHANLYFETIHDKMLQVFEELGFENGICAIQGFVENGHIMFYDPALRITGGQEYVLINHFTGLNELNNLIYFALNGKMLNDNEINKCDATYGGQFGCNLTFSVKPCVISKIEGLEQVRSNKNVINITQEHHVGDVISQVGTAQQNISRMHIFAESAQDMHDLINYLQSTIVVIDEEGENAIIDGLDADLWLEEYSNEKNA